jgi:hypothetical protein
MRKSLFIGLILFFSLSVAVFANRGEIEDFLKAYEAMVVEAEKLAARPSVGINDFSALTEKAETVQKKALTVEKGTDWTEQDSQRVNALTERWTKAWTAISQKLTY